MNLAEVVTSEYAVPDDIDLLEVADRLVDLLGDPDPVVRDEQAYSILANWLRAGHLDAALRDIGDRCAVNLSAPDVLSRSFSALILAEAVRRQRQVQVLPVHVPAIWYACWERWYATESDVRSHEDRIGWIHAVAHGADFAREWALYSPDNETLRHLMEHLVHRLSTLPIHLNQTEDDRIALAMLAILSHEDFEPSDIQEKFEHLQRLWLPRTYPQPPGAALGIRVLHSLHTLVRLGADVDGEIFRPAYPQETAKHLMNALRSTFPNYAG